MITNPKLFAGALAVSATVVTTPTPAVAHTAQLGRCNSSPSALMHLPATRDLVHSGHWGDIGYRSCDVASSDSHIGPRSTIWIRCTGGNGINPIANIVNRTTGQRTQHSVTCNGRWHSWSSGVSGWPGGTNSDRYGFHLWETDVWLNYDAVFTGGEVRWGVAP